jgi:hypothetical protein
MPPYTCNCGGWKKITNPAEDIAPGVVVRIGDGSWRLLTREGITGFEQVPGIGWVPEANPASPPNG